MDFCREYSVFLTEAFTSIDYPGSKIEIMYFEASGSPDLSLGLLRFGDNLQKAVADFEILFSVYA
jgi:hypothetical protein